MQHLDDLIPHVLFDVLGSFFAWFVPLAFFVVGGAVVVDRTKPALRLVLKSTAIVILVNSLFALLSFTRQSETLSGSLGQSISSWLTTFIGEIGATIFLVACLLIILLGEIGYFGEVTWAALRDWVPSRGQLRSFVKAKP